MSPSAPSYPPNETHSAVNNANDQNWRLVVPFSSELAWRYCVFPETNTNANFQFTSQWLRQFPIQFAVSFILRFTQWVAVVPLPPFVYPLICSSSPLFSLPSLPPFLLPAPSSISHSFPAYVSPGFLFSIHPLLFRWFRFTLTLHSQSLISQFDAIILWCDILVTTHPSNLSSFIHSFLVIMKELNR